MKKRVLGMLMALTLVGTMLAGCGSNGAASTGSASDIKIGAIYIGDENEGYTASHMNGLKDAIKAMGYSESQLIEKTNIPEDESAYDAAVDLAEQGCSIIFANSFGHESYLLQAAQEYPEVDFYHATGYQAAGSGLSNFHNYFTKIYEARYVSGVVAGLKLNEMIANGEITEDAVKLGYVGAYPYAEVVSGYTAFFLGVRSQCPSATMEVQYTNSWGDMAAEKEVATQLIADGCVLICQHADTTGAPSACQELGVPCVGYNVSMISVAPDVALTSSTNVWGKYYTLAIKNKADGVANPTDWADGYAVDAVAITELNDKTVAAGTKEKVAEVEAALKAGTLHVFDTTTFTVDGAQVADGSRDEVKDGYFHESEAASAPSFDLRIDGITEK